MDSVTGKGKPRNAAWHWSGLLDPSGSHHWWTNLLIKNFALVGRWIQVIGRLVPAPEVKGNRIWHFRERKGPFGQDYKSACLSYPGAGSPTTTTTTTTTTDDDDRATEEPTGPGPEPTKTGPDHKKRTETPRPEPDRDRTERTGPKRGRERSETEPERNGRGNQRHRGPRSLGRGANIGGEHRKLVGNPFSAREHRGRGCKHRREKNRAREGFTKKGG